jgi:hypothetical protein
MRCRIQLARFSTALLCVLCRLVEGASVNATAPAEVEEKAVAARRAIVSGELRMKAERWDVQRQRRKVYDEELTVFFDRDKVRLERQQFLPAVGKAADGTAEKTVYVVTDKEGMFYSNVRASLDPRIAAKAGVDKTAGKESLAEARPVMAVKGRRDQIDLDGHRVFDPRTIGMIPTWLSGLQAAPIDLVLTRPDRKSTSTRAESIGGEPVQRVEYERKDGCWVRAWISPAKNYSVLRMEIAARRKDGEWVTSIECRPKAHNNGAVWFPESVTARKHRNGELMSEEIATIRSAAFNQAVDPALFTVEGLGMPPGHMIQDLSNASTGTWDGEKVVPLAAPPPPPADLKPRIRKTWLLLSLASAAAAALVLWVLWREKVTATKFG